MNVGVGVRGRCASVCDCKSPCVVVCVVVGLYQETSGGLYVPVRGRTSQRETRSVGATVRRHVWVYVFVSPRRAFRVPSSASK